MANRLNSIKIVGRLPKKFKNIKYPEIPLNINDIYIVTIIGDRLDLLADKFYNDQRLWWIIANANRDIVRRDSYALKPGIEIRIPSNIQKILGDFDNINN